MNQLAYFRKLYEYEKSHGYNELIRYYIHNKNTDIINDLMVGNLNLPSPFLIDELGWSLDLEDDKIRNIFYQLKVHSRDFYSSLIELENVNYNKHFIQNSSSIGQQLIYHLNELRAYHALKQHKWLNIFYNKIVMLMNKHPYLLHGMHGILSIWCFIIFWSLSIAFKESYNLSNSMIFTTLTIICLAVAFRLEHKINLFSGAPLTNISKLASKYRHFVSMLKQTM